MMRTIEQSWRAALLLSFLAATVSAQQPAASPAGSPPPIQILLATGQTVETTSVRRDRDMVMARIEVGGSTGEVGYQAGQIQRINFPEPRGIKRATELLSQGNAEQALQELNPLISFYSPFRDIEGSWWGPAALLKVSALAALGRDREAEPLAQEIQRTAKNPETARAANLRLASALISKRQFDKAAEICQEAIKASTEPGVLADAWVIQGNLHSAQKEWAEALLAYLRVPVFYPAQKLHLPEALLGAGRAYRRLEDLERAKRSFNDLIAMFPKSSEAALAQTELKRIK